MEVGNPQDPLLLQVLPLDAEFINTEGYNFDPVGDQQASPHPGLLHKYQGRVLIVVTGACAIHCRYCFRRHFPYSEHHIDNTQWQQNLSYIQADDSIHEVILSGGDPLSLSDERLQSMVNDLASIQHIKRLRIHTRLPIMVPQRVTSSLLDTLIGNRLYPVVVVHINHANEIDSDVSLALNRMKNAGITLLNQSVLLKNINNNIQTLSQLSESLMQNGVLPYYLHQLDKVQGAAHFAVGPFESRMILKGLRDQLPGYLVPKLVQETKGASAKLPVLSE